MIRAMLNDGTLSATAAGRLAGFTREDASPCWVRRFNAAGVDGLLRDAARVRRRDVTPNAAPGAMSGRWGGGSGS